MQGKGRHKQVPADSTNKHHPCAKGALTPALERPDRGAREEKGEAEGESPEPQAALRRCSGDSARAAAPGPGPGPPHAPPPLLSSGAVRYMEVEGEESQEAAGEHAALPLPAA